MADEFTPPGFAEPRSDIPMQEGAALDDAIDRARAELNAMIQAASEADQLGASNERYTLHEIPGVSRFAVPRDPGWTPQLIAINDPKSNIDFSPVAYPFFDDMVAQHFNGTQLSDPLDDEFESYRHLRENLAA